MNGNQVRTVFGNWGVIGQPAQLGHRGAWRNDNNGYLGDVSPMVGAEIVQDTTVFHSVATCPVDRPTQLRDENPLTGKPWTFEPVAGYFNPNQEKVALSTDRTTWPQFWPDKLNDANDPGWRNSWNGYFGKRISADMESYFLMDDNNDERFNKAQYNIWGVAFRPNSADSTRNGMGLVVSVRALQWAQFLAKDNIFWLYEIHNTGTTDYNKVVFGMIVGTYVGVTSTEDYQEYRDDWSFYDAANNITYTGDFGRHIDDPFWVGPVGMVGYAFLESPGDPFDGIDNDDDADSSAIGRLAPKFTSSMFDSTLISSGMQLVLINNDFSRSLYTVPSVPLGDSVLVTTRGKSVYIKPGITKVAEGNILQKTVTDPVYGPISVDYVNPNAYNGVDDNFNGLIDENYYVHYHQLKRPRKPGPPLIDILRPLRYVDYKSGAGSSPYSMIDEKRNDRIDNNSDWNSTKDDVGRDGIPNTHDYGENDGKPTSGYDDLGFDTGLPGEPHIDKTDVRESDQIGLTSFFYFAPSNQVRLGDDESLWTDLAPGYFDVPPSIVNNKPQGGEDGDFIYGSGYFPLLKNSTERFSLALVYGGGKGGSVDDDVADLLKNKQTVQKIYDANYQFPQPPDRPTLTAVPGDHQVTLYWDRKAEASVDPVLGTKDFEGYKIYKSTDPNWSDIFTITDGTGSPQGYRPQKQFDLKDGITGFFKPNAELYEASSGYAFYLGDDSGLQHTFVDNDVQNGRTYYYAVVAYDRGDEVLGIFPSENTKLISVLPSGETYHDINVAIVKPNAPVAGYSKAPDGVPLTPVVKYGTGSVSYSAVDPAKIIGHTYQLTFLDTQNDGIDNNNNGLIDAQDSTEGDRVTTYYFVRDLSDLSDAFISQDTAFVNLPRKNLIASTVVVKDSRGNVIPPADYILDVDRGVIKGSSHGSLPTGSYSIAYQYYPVYRSPNMQKNPVLVENKDADIFDGVQLNFSNDWFSAEIDTSSKWVGGDPYRFSFSPIYSQFTVPTPMLVVGVRKPSDYRIEFANSYVDTSIDYAPGFLTATPVNFRIYNETDSTYIKFAFFDNDLNTVISPLDELWFYEKGPSGRYSFTWNIEFTGKLVGGVVDTSTKYLHSGVELLLRTTKPFRKGDVLQFTTTPATTNTTQMKSDIANVKVVPNPYVTASIFEPPLNPGITSGRGTRKIDFIHVPPQAAISIFTSRGDHVITLRQDGNIEDGTVSWNLKTKENLDIAYGVYFYVVDSPVGTKTGKFAIIK